MSINRTIKLKIITRQYLNRDISGSKAMQSEHID